MQQRPPEHLLAVFEVQSERQYVAVPERVGVFARREWTVRKVARELQEASILELRRVNPLDVPAFRECHEKGDRLEIQVEDVLIERPSIES